MDPADAFGAREVRDGAGDSQHSRVAARRQPHGLRRLHQQPLARLVRGCEPLERLTIEFGIGARAGLFGPRGLDGASGGNACRDLGAALGGRRQGEIDGADRVDLDVEIDTVEQRTGNLALIIGGAARGAAARERGIAEMAAAARVHCRHQLHPRGKGDVGIGARDVDLSGFKRLSQGIQHGPLEFQHYVANAPNR